MDRYVVDVNVYEVRKGELVKVGRGVTHYPFEFQRHMVGEALRHELVAVGLPASVQVTVMGGVDANGKGPAEVTLPGDDKGKYASKIAKVIEKHAGTEAADHKALIEFTGSIHSAVAALEAGKSITQDERDILMMVALKAGGF